MSREKLKKKQGNPEQKQKQKRKVKQKTEQRRSKAKARHLATLVPSVDAARLKSSIVSENATFSVSPQSEDESEEADGRDEDAGSGGNDDEIDNVVREGQRQPAKFFSEL